MSHSQLLEQFEDGGRLLRFVHISQRAAETRPVSVYIPPPAIEERLAFETTATQPSEWGADLDEMLERATQQLGGQSTLSLSVAIETTKPRNHETTKGRAAASRLLREAVNQARPLQMPARTLLRSLLTKGVAVEAIEVRLGLLQNRSEQGTIFETKPDSQRLALRRVLSHLEARYAGAMPAISRRTRAATRRAI